MPGPVRPSPGGAFPSALPQCRAAERGRAGGLGAALHCSTAGAPSFPAPFSALRRRSAPEAQPGARTGPAALRSHSHGASATSDRRSRSGNAAVGEGRAPTAGVSWPVSTRAHQPRTGGGTGRPRRGIRCPARPAPRRQRCPAVRPGHLPPFPCHPPRRSGHAVSPDGAPGLAWASHCPHRVPARAFGLVPGEPGPPPRPGKAEGAVPGGTAPLRTRPHGTVPPALRAPALPMGWAEGGDQRGVPGPWGREDGNRAPASSTWGQRPGARCQPRVTGSCWGSGSHDPRVLRAGGAKGSGAIPVGRSRRWPRVPGPAPLPGGRAGGDRERGHGAGAASAPAQRGPVPKAPALSLLWENASTVTKWRGKGGIVTASPAA